MPERRFSRFSTPGSLALPFDVLESQVVTLWIGGGRARSRTPPPPISGTTLVMALRCLKSALQWTSESAAEVKNPVILENTALAVPPAGHELGHALAQQMRGQTRVDFGRRENRNASQIYSSGIGCRCTRRCERKRIRHSSHRGISFGGPGAPSATSPSATDFRTATAVDFTNPGWAVNTPTGDYAGVPSGTATTFSDIEWGAGSGAVNVALSPNQTVWTFTFGGSRTLSLWAP